MSLGLRRSGFDVRTAFDLDECAVSTYRKNIGEHAFRADATKITSHEMLEGMGLGVGELDLLAGGPPCQGFSKQNRGAHLGDDRNQLVLEFLRLVRELRPRSFLLENVSQMAQTRGIAFVQAFEHELSEYWHTGHFYMAANYGVAQTRERFVLVGIRDDVPGGYVIPEPQTPTWLTVQDAIGDLPEPPNDYSHHPLFPNHQAARVTKINVERFSYVPPGGGWQDIPYELRIDCHKVADVKSGGWPDVYGRLRWEGQCPTVTGGFDSFTRGRYGHPSSDRPLTPREAARLQGFPDSFVFLGTRHDIRHQIGNAVPVPLAHAIGTAIVDTLQGRSQTPTKIRQAAMF